MGDTEVEYIREQVNAVPMWTSDSSVTALRADHTKTFDLHMTIRIPPVHVLYVASPRVLDESHSLLA
jgi:hypothetical protein